MNIGITSVAFSGYGKYVQGFVDAIARSTVYPHQVTIVLGQDHGFDTTKFKAPKNLPYLKFLMQEGVEPDLDMLTNMAIENTETDWIMTMNVTDQLLPNAIKELAKTEDEADCICIAWRGAGKYRQSPLPETIAKMQASKRPESPINKSSPFRRRFWEMQPYNRDFLSHLVEQDARFIKLTKPCILKGVSNA